MTVPMLPTEFLYLQTHTVTMYPQDLYQAHNKAKGKAGRGTCILEGRRRQDATGIRAQSWTGTESFAGSLMGKRREQFWQCHLGHFV